MSGKKNKTSRNLTTDKMSLTELSALKREIEAREYSLFRDSANSSDPQEILKAHQYLTMQESMYKQQMTNMKAYLYSPELDYYNGQAYREPVKRVSFATLRRMARTPFAKAVIQTRVNQVSNFGSPSSSEQDRGWIIRKKRRAGLLFSETNETESQGDPRIIEYITNFLVEGGDLYYDQEPIHFSGLYELLRALTKDSLEVDQACCELIYTNGGSLAQIIPIDAATMRLVDTSPSRMQELPLKDGQIPRYCQVYLDQVYTWFYHDEIAYGIRNHTTDIYANGYGLSELEDCIQLVTYLLFGTQYNGNFFVQGSNPKGFFSIEGNVSQEALSDFKQMWRDTITGTMNSHRVPVIESGKNSKISWIDMQNTNRDMEFHQWMDFLTVLFCCVYQIDPTEVGFNINKSNNIFGQEGQRSRLKQSKEKGLIPIMMFFQRYLTKNIVARIDKDYEFFFTGVEDFDSDRSLEQDLKKLQNGLVSLEDSFYKYSGRKFDPEKDTLLNPTYAQMQAAQMNGGSMMNGIAEEEGGREEDATQENPFVKSLLSYLDRDNPQENKSILE